MAELRRQILYSQCVGRKAMTKAFRYFNKEQDLCRQRVKMWMPKVYD